MTGALMFFGTIALIAGIVTFLDSIAHHRNRRAQK